MVGKHQPTAWALVILCQPGNKIGLSVRTTDTTSEHASWSEDTWLNEVPEFVQFQRKKVAPSSGQLRAIPKCLRAHAHNQLRMTTEYRQHREHELASENT